MDHRAEWTDGVGLAAGGVWVFYIAGRGLSGPGALPRTLYLLLRNYDLCLPPRERGDSPLRCYASPASAQEALEDALDRYRATLTNEEDVT